jgi:DNA-directed RNA polymerase subunit F
MAEFEIVNETPVTLVELKEKLSSIEKRDKELTFKANKTKEYLSSFTDKKLKDVKELREKIESLNIPRLKDRHIVKIIDVHPVDMDSLKSLLSAETITIKEEDLKKILAIL